MSETQSDGDGYPLYRRRAPEHGGKTFKIMLNGSSTVIDNRWIVPYNPLLSRMFQAHINVEIANSVKAIKYVCKYVYKGTDLASFQIVDKTNNMYDEVTAFEVGRYISSNEAAWRLMSFPVHQHHPPVEHLNVHLENGERVMFKSDATKDDILPPKPTKLTAFFSLCNNDEFARGLLYADVPTFYIWNNKEKQWKRRKQGQRIQPTIFKAKTLARMYSVHPNQYECYFLRLLLTRKHGPTSFKDLKTVDDVIHSTFRSACCALGMLQNDDMWKNTLRDATECQTPETLRDLFVVMLLYCNVSNPLQLWTEFSKDFSEDIE